MSQVLTFAEARDSLAEVIASKNVLLVLGAGASASSGAPLTNALVSQIADRFPQADIRPTAQLFDACREVEDTPAYGRQDLVRFISEALSSLTPSASYRQLPRIRWRGIFTTNYDDLIEKAYQSPARVQTLQPIPLEYRAAIIPRDNHVQLHYLMGSAKEPYKSESAPVLTWADYTRTLQTRVPVMQLFQNLLADGGKVIYVGYSFNDLVFEGILDEAARRIGLRNLPYGYALLLDWPADRRRGFQRITTRQVIPVDGTFEEFASLLQEIADRGETSFASPLVAPTSPASGKKIRIGSHETKLTESEAGVYSEAFEVIDDAVAFQPKLERDERASLARRLFRGEAAEWAAYALGLPFRRPAYAGIQAAVVERYRSNGRDDDVILVHGPAALGKSIMARQLAYDMHVEHKAPVVLVKSAWRSRPDMKLLDRLIDDLEAGLPEGEILPPLIIIVDEAELLDRAVPRRLAAFLRARQRNYVLVLFARTNEFFRLGKNGGGGVPDEVAQFFSLTDAIEAPEVSALIKHLVHIGLWDGRRVTSEGFWQNHVANEWNSSFFDTVYALVEDTQVPLRERVWSEYLQLSETAQQAYLLIAAVHQFGIMMKMEILMRALAVNFSTFDAEIIRGDAREVLLSEETTGELNIHFRGRTRLISRLVFERALPTSGAQLPMFIKFVQSVNPSEIYGLDELDALRALLIHVLGSGGYDSRFSPNELSELYRAATAVVEDDVLEHHFGLVEKEAGRLQSAREHLTKALRLSSTLPYDLASFRESPQNIENSLAIVAGLLANDALRRNDLSAADELFNEARGHFVNARAGAFPNAAAYDAHARMLITRARRLYAAGTTERALALVEALDVSSDGIDNVNEEYRVELMELQAEVMADLGLHRDAIADLSKRAESVAPRERARYEVLLARLTLGAEGSEAKKKRVRSALGYATSACTNDPEYFAAWKLRSELHKVLYPGELKDFITYLEAARRCPDARDNHWMLYELAVAYFEGQQYDKSAAVFSKLRRVTSGHGRAVGVIGRAGEEGDGAPYEFSGRLVRSEVRAGYAVRSEDLAAFGEIFFSQRSERFYTPRLGDLVSFVVGFNYKGLMAVDIKRL